MKYPFFSLLIFALVHLEAQNLKTPSLSPYAEIKQEIGLTEMSLSYSRPSAKGRRIFGELVPYGEIWRTGANASTKLSVSEEIIIAGKALPAGTYAIYSIPGRQQWTIIIHKKTDMRSIAGGRVKPENDAFRFQLRPIFSPEKVETFTIQFADITSRSCHLQMAWENTIVNIPISVEVESKIEARMAELMLEPEKISPQVYFRAAEYYLHNNIDLDQAMIWIDAALDKSENNFRYGLLKAKIYAGQDKTNKAIEMVSQANEWATEAKNANYMEQTSVYLGILEQVWTEPVDLRKYQEDVASLDNIMAALYNSISGEKGEKRDWNRFENLFIKEARLIPSSKNAEGVTNYNIMTPAFYSQNIGFRLEEIGFFEKEISREVVEYGSMVHVFSTYESYHSEKDETPFARGINSIQLLNDGQRWWIIQVYWLGETEDQPLPKAFLPKE